MGVKLMVEVLDYAPEDLTATERLVLVALAERARDDTRDVLPRESETVRGMVMRRARLTDSGLRKVLSRLAARGLECRVPLAADKEGRPVYAFEGRTSSYRVPVLRADLLGLPLDDERQDERDASGQEKAGRTGRLGGTGGPPLEPERQDERDALSLLSVGIPDARLLAAVDVVTDTLGACDDAADVAVAVLEEFRRRNGGRDPDDLARYIGGIVKKKGPDGLVRFRGETAGKGGHRARSGRGRPAGPRCPSGYPFDLDDECGCGEGHRRQHEAEAS